jgi:hypothetical protein
MTPTASARPPVRPSASPPVRQSASPPARQVAGPYPWCRCHCPGRDSAIPSRAAHSTGSRRIDLSPLKILRELSCRFRRTGVGGRSALGDRCALCPVRPSPRMSCRAATGPGPRNRRGNGRGPEGQARWRSAAPTPWEGSVERLIWPPGRRAIGRSAPAEARGQPHPPRLFGDDPSCCSTPSVPLGGESLPRRERCGGRNLARLPKISRR